MNLAPVWDIGLILPIIGLSGISLSIIASTTPDLFSQQLLFYFVGFIFFFLFASIDYRIWSRFKWLFYLSSLFLLVIIFLNSQIRGASRWIDIGWIHIQPSEVIKPFITIFLASLIMEENNNKLTSKFKSFIFFLPIILLIFKQPDLGNVMVFVFAYFALEVMYGLKFIYIITMIIGGGVMWPLLWHALRAYQKIRILSFINPLADPVGAGYNAIQAMIALGSGQLLGLGLGRGTQSHLLFLPEYHTDFVFASLGEELGFLGAFLVIVFYFILLSRMLRIALKSTDLFGQLLTIGIFSQLFFQIFVNIGMNLGILPITGITLPLLSYGGSSILSTFIGLGMIASVAKLSKSKTYIVIK